ncbi:hypothetical protein RIF29_41132 [Crotalaria pallida]|uniref:Pectinesterase inhibitor domain-containing protein n=1 Tax=Crotalaria pallida TaxID=3830 RepID=A0AAN9HP32_CROPI
MKLNNQIFFSSILICFALLGDCAYGFPNIFAPFFSSPTPASAPSPAPTPTPTPTPSASSPTSLHTEGRKTMATTTSYNAPKASAQFFDTPNTAGSGSPSNAPTPTADGASDSSFADYLKAKYGDQSKIKYSLALEHICGKTHHSDVCLATISPLLKSKVDVVNVLQAAVAVTTQHVKMSISKIEKHPAVSRDVAASLNDCRDHYSKALVNLQKAKQSIQSRDFGSVTLMLSGVLADVSSAESKIEDLKPSAFKADNFYSLVSVTASNSLSIASMIKN